MLLAELTNGQKGMMRKPRRMNFQKGWMRHTKNLWGNCGMDERAFIGSVSTFATFGLGELHLVVGILAGCFTIAYMAICIREKLKKK